MGGPSDAEITPTSMTSRSGGGWWVPELGRPFGGREYGPPSPPPSTVTFRGEGTTRGGWMLWSFRSPPADEPDPASASGLSAGGVPALLSRTLDGGPGAMGCRKLSSDFRRLMAPGPGATVPVQLPGCSCYSEREVPRGRGKSSPVPGKHGGGD